MLLILCQVQLDQEVSAGREKDKEIAALKATIQQQLAEIDNYNRMGREHETMRRQLHNTIQELKVLYECLF